MSCMGRRACGYPGDARGRSVAVQGTVIVISGDRPIFEDIGIRCDTGVRRVAEAICTNNKSSHDGGKNLKLPIRFVTGFISISPAGFWHLIGCDTLKIAEG